MLQILYHRVFDIVNVPLDLPQYILGIGIFIAIYFALFQFFNLFSEKFRKRTKFPKKIHIVLQSVKFSNKIIVNIVTLGCLLLWDERLLLVENWNQFQDIFYNLSSLFVWSDIVALLLTRSSMTFLCQLHHLGVVAAYLHVITTTDLGDGLFRACIMYGVFAASAFFHNLYTVVKNLWTLSQVADVMMNRISHVGMLASNLVNWSWQVFYLLSLTLTYWQSGVLLHHLPAIAFYLTLLLTFVKESSLMISHFSKQAVRKLD